MQPGSAGGMPRVQREVGERPAVCMLSRRKKNKNKTQKRRSGEENKQRKSKAGGCFWQQRPPAPAPWQPLLGGRAAEASQQAASPAWVGIFGSTGVFVHQSGGCSTKWSNPSSFRNLQLDRIPWDGQCAGASLVSKTLPSPPKPGSGECPPGMPAPAFPRSEKQVAKSQQNHERKTTET